MTKAAVLTKNVLTKNTDSKGRITLGEGFANRTLLMEERGDEIVLRLARVVPESEAWLYDNKEALASLRRGLKQARSGQFVEQGPDLKEAQAISDQIEEE